MLAAIMGTSGTTVCPACKGLQEELANLRAKLADLEAKLAKAQKNSSNSSKPPSSDIVKPPRPKGKRKRKLGGQPGHARHQRPPFEVSQVDECIDYALPVCPDCGGPVEASDEPPRVVQQVEIVAKPTTVTEHRGNACWCDRCQKTYHAPIDPAVRRAGLLGPRLTALVAFLKCVCHASFSTVRKFLRDVVGVRVSRGYLAKVCAKVSDSLQASYEQLLKLLPTQSVVNADETGHKNNGEQYWTWCFRAPLFTLFKISPSRGSDVLLDVLGAEFDGVLGCDYFSAYRKYMGECNVLVQFCLAHLIRDIKFLANHPDRRNRAYGKRLLNAVRNLFSLIHRRERMSAKRFALDLEDAGNELWGAAVWHVPNTPEADNLAKRFENHGESYIRFITTPGIDPTNNLAEQAIRFVVLDRHVTQGTRSETGQHWSERIWTVVATCAQQGRSVFSFLYDSVVAFCQGTSPPTLVVDSP
jgi:transposase